MQSAELEARIARIKELDFNYNDALYKLVAEFIVAPYIPEMDKRFDKKHSVSELGGAGMTGSDTSALVITVPREKRKGFLNGLLRAFSPEKTVIKFSLAFDYCSSIAYLPEYRSMAKTIEVGYKKAIEPHLFS